MGMDGIERVVKRARGTLTDDTAIAEEPGSPSNVRGKRDRGHIRVHSNKGHGENQE